MMTLLKPLIKTSLLPFGMIAVQSGISLLVYHKVGGTLPLDIDMPPALLERQFTYLAQTGQVISYEDGITALQTGMPNTTPRYVLTFDDGFEDFYTIVWPILKALNLPAILFVTTGFVEDGITPLSTGYTVSPVTWDMLGHLHESKLVTLGAHTHTHPSLPDVSLDQAAEELSYPLKLFQQRLGFRPQHFAYPRALWNPDLETLVQQHYQTAVIGGGRRATPRHFTPYRIPRVPIRASDGWFFFRAKLRGWLHYEETAYATLRRLKRFVL